MTASASSTPFSLTGNNSIDSITHGYYWILDSSRTVRWALADGFAGEYWINQQNAYDAFNQALQMVSYYANISFQYAGYFQSPLAAANQAEITFSMDAAGNVFNSSNVWAIGMFPSTSYNNVYPGAPGDIFLNLNSQASQLPSYAPGSAGFGLFLHEIGHVVGLKHPHDDGGTGRPTFAGLGIPQADQDWFSIMSYNDYYSWNTLAWEPFSYMALDALGLMAIYGPNMATNAGNSSFSLTALDGYMTLWDASGTDTLDITWATEGWGVSLQIATNNLLGIKVGMAFPGREVLNQQPTSLWWLLGDYENVAGSAHPDYIAGNDGANVLNGAAGDDLLEGAGGNDTINGGDGIDMAHFEGNRALFTTVRTGSASFTVSRPGDSDTLASIERLSFADIRIAYDLVMQQSGAETALLLGATLGRSALANLSMVGSLIGYFDGGNSMLDAANALVSSGFMNQLAGGSSTTAFVNAIYRAVTGQEAGAAVSAQLANLIDGGNFTRAGFLAAVAELPENQMNVNLVGLQASGLDFIDFV
jgi:serralysin